MSVEHINAGNVVVHRVRGFIGICEESEYGISVRYKNMSGRYGRTIGDYPHFVAQHWRLATDEEVRRYFDAD